MATFYEKLTSFLDSPCETDADRHELQELLSAHSAFTPAQQFLSNRDYLELKEQAWPTKYTASANPLTVSTESDCEGR